MRRKPAHGAKLRHRSLIREILIVIHHPLDTVSENRHMKVNKESDMQIKQAKIGEKLCFVDWMQRLFAFDFNHHLAVDHHVRSKSAIELHELVDQSHRLLPLHVESGFVEFIRQADFISRFEESRSESAMNLDGGPIIVRVVWDIVLPRFILWVDPMARHRPSK